jgi:hypothetical protein
VEDVKYTKRRPQKNLQPLVSHLSLRPSHSDSCSPLNVNERQAVTTWTARTALVTHPKSVMSVEAVLERISVSHHEDKRKTNAGSYRASPKRPMVGGEETKCHSHPPESPLTFANISRVQIQFFFFPRCTTKCTVFVNLPMNLTSSRK